jgi:hypothetical protein
MLAWYAPFNYWASGPLYWEGYCVCMHLTCIPIATWAGLPFDLKYLTWAELRETALCTVVPFCWWGDQLAAWWCGINYVTSWSCTVDVDAVCALEYLQTLTPNDLPKTKPAFTVECPVMLCATYILPEASEIVQGYWSPYPPHMSLRVAIWEVNMMESQCPFLESPYTHIGVTIHSSLHAINSLFTLPLQWQSREAKDSLPGM